MRFTAEAIEAWRAEPRTRRGGQSHYSPLAIVTALTLRAVFRLTLCQIEGLLGSIVALLGIDLALSEPAPLAARYPDAEIIVPPRSSAVPSDTAETAPTQRDRHVRAIAERSRMDWQKASSYSLRALAEADIVRFMRVIGDKVRSRTDDRHRTEVAIAADVLNRMVKLGRPEYVRVA